jgi:hypothetical protein
MKKGHAVAEILGTNWVPFVLGRVWFPVFGGNLYQEFLPQHVLSSCPVFIASLSRVKVSSSVPQSERNTPPGGRFLRSIYMYIYVYLYINMIYVIYLHVIYKYDIFMIYTYIIHTCIYTHTYIYMYMYTCMYMYRYRYRHTYNASRGMYLCVSYIGTH